MKPIIATSFLRILQGQASSLHILISFLNSGKDSEFSIFGSTMAHILVPRNLTDWTP